MFLIGSPSELKVSVENISDFYKSYWKRRGILLSYKSFYKWQLGFNRDNSIIVLDKDKLIGVINLNAIEFMHYGNSYKGCQIIAQLVHPEYRGKGVGSMLLKNLKKDYDVVISMGITDAAKSLYLKLGFIYSKYIPRLIKLNPESNLPDWLEVSKIGKDLIQIRKNEQKNEINLKELTTKDELSNLKEIYSIHNYQYPSFLLSAEYLSWRYLNHPIFKYKIYLLSSSENQSINL